MSPSCALKQCPQAVPKTFKLLLATYYTLVHSIRWHLQVSSLTVAYRHHISPNIYLLSNIYPIMSYAGRVVQTNLFLTLVCGCFFIQLRNCFVHEDETLWLSLLHIRHKLKLADAMVMLLLRCAEAFQEPSFDSKTVFCCCDKAEIRNDVICIE